MDAAPLPPPPPLFFLAGKSNFLDSEMCCGPTYMPTKRFNLEHWQKLQLGV